MCEKMPCSTATGLQTGPMLTSSSVHVIGSTMCGSPNALCSVLKLWVPGRCQQQGTMTTMTWRRTRKRRKRRRLARAAAAPAAGSRCAPVLRPENAEKGFASLNTRARRGLTDVPELLSPERGRQFSLTHHGNGHMCWNIKCMSRHAVCVPFTGSPCVCDAWRWKLLNLLRGQISEMFLMYEQA